MENVQSENALLNKELDALELQVSRLSYDHSNGAYNPLTTKVLELRENPDLIDHAIRTSTLERLKDENNALLDRITHLERRKISADGEECSSLVPRESLVSLRKEFEELQAVIEQKEKMNKRLIDVCSSLTSIIPCHSKFYIALISLLSSRLTNRHGRRRQMNSAKPYSHFLATVSTSLLPVESKSPRCMPPTRSSPSPSLPLQAM